VDVIEDSFRLADLLTFMRGMLLSQGDEFSTQKKIPLNLPYFQDQTITHLEKVFQINSQTDRCAKIFVLQFILSVRMCLAKIGSISKSKCDEIIQGIENLVKDVI